MELAHLLDGYNRRGTPVFLRFAHEMNGSWHPWGQQPQAYVSAFRRIADEMHRRAPGTAMMWAPNYGGGYPFAGGSYQARSGTAAARALDTDGDGSVTGADDPYAPYWPGRRYVDWVGMSIYHWGAAYPWGENEVPEPGRFTALLRGPTTAPPATNGRSPTSTPSTAEVSTCRSRSRRPVRSTRRVAGVPPSSPPRAPGGDRSSRPT